jgi:hypothetical protein
MPRRRCSATYLRVTQTSRLLTLQQRPSHIERLLDALVARSDLLPAGAYRIRDLASAPKELRRIAKLAAPSGRAWSCWAKGPHAWLVTAELDLPLSRERGAPVLQVDVYDEDGPRDCDLWLPDQEGRWQRSGG